MWFFLADVKANSSDLEEAMTESGESLSNSKKYCSVLEKISKIKL